MRRAFPAAFVALAAALGVAGTWLLFTTFRTYDDEGYVLFSLANFAREGGLYTRVYSQYGPGFFLIADAAHRLLGFEFTHTAGRVITLFHWLGAAALGGHLVWRHGRSAAWALFALAATFGHLWQMTSEPMHPGGFIAFVVALGAWAGAEFIARENSRGLGLVAGLVGATLVLTKINVGALFIAGAGGWLLLYSTGPRLARLAPWLPAAGFVMLPWALTHSLLPEEWIVTFAAVVGCAAVGIILAAREARRVWFRPSGWGSCIGAGLAALTLVVAAAALRGTAPHELLEGVLLGPLRHPGVYSFAVRWRDGVRIVAFVSLVLAAVTVLSGVSRRTWFAPALAGLRLILAGIAATSWLGWLPLNPLALVMSYGLSCSWLFVVPLGTDDAALRSARIRAWVALLAVTQSLHAYPVGGSQIGWGTFLWAPLLALGAADAASVLRPWIARLIAPVAIAFACGVALALGRVGWSQWHESEPLGLPGAEALQLEPALSTELRTLTVNATAHCDLLFSLPGMFSFNLWTGLPAPSSANVTHWFNLLTPAQQAEIIAKMEAHPRSGVIVERDVLGLIMGSGIPVGGPLRDYIYAHYEAAFATGSHEFWVRRGRAVAPLGTVQVLHRKADAPGERVRLVICATAAGRRVARVEWMDGDGVRLALTAGNARAELEPLRIDGASTAAPAAGWEAPLPPIARLVISTDAPEALAGPTRGTLFRLRDAGGGLIGEAILRD